ncbi:hypothetical protein MTO96_031167 [Rhipicephalus appendiculatus]
MSTPSSHLADALLKVQELFLGQRTYPVSAYLAAPDDSCKGIVPGLEPGTPSHTPVEEMQATGIQILQAQMMGQKNIALVTFEGLRVPRFVRFLGAELRCYAHRPRQQVCKTCLKLGDRADHCPTPDVTVCEHAPGGAIGIPVAAALSDICREDSAYKLLTTPNLELREMALSDAYAIASARLGWEATSSELEAHLSGEIEGVIQAPATQLRSVWTEARKAALDPFSHQYLTAPVTFQSTTQERGTPIRGAWTQGRRVAAAAHSSAGGTSRNPPVCFQCGGQGHNKSQCPSRLPGQRARRRGNDKGRRW